MKTYDILVAGEINPDLILSGNVTPEFDQVEKPAGVESRFRQRERG